MTLYPILHSAWSYSNLKDICYYHHCPKHQITKMERILEENDPTQVKKDH